MMKSCGAVDTIAFILVLVGALNWGLVGFFGFDLVATLLGQGTMLARIVYMLVGVSALYCLFIWMKGCKS